MTGSHDDQSLIEQCRAGKTEAFGILVRRYQDRLYPTILRLCGRAEDAHDLLQDTFLRAYEKLGRFQGESSFYTWIYRIAVNLSLSDRRKRRVPGRVAPAKGGETVETADASGRSDPSLPTQRAEEDALIQKALSELTPEFRSVVVLKDLDGLRYEEIADVLGIPVGTVRSRLHRARGELKERLRGVLDLPPAPADTPALTAPCPRLVVPHALLTPGRHEP
jgi:RNA polymerase sigma-70 factor, ECF subfamily